MQTYDFVDEFLKRYYKMSELHKKTKLLTKYYKFHTDVPRLFMFPLVKKINKYHDSKRKIEYDKITKIIAEEERIEKGLPAVDPTIQNFIINRPKYTRLLAELKFEDDCKESLKGLEVELNTFHLSHRPKTRTHSSLHCKY